MRVTVYSTPTCPFCKLAKDFLRGKNVVFTAVDISTDQDKAQEMIKKSGQMGVPVISVVNDNGHEEIIIGFERDKLARAVGVTE